MLNYGYTVLRAATARAVIAAGLHPGIGLQHSNAQNPMRLVDDLMEPFRPVIDLVVYELAAGDSDELSPDIKRELVHALYRDMSTAAGRTPLNNCLTRLAVSLAQVLQGIGTSLDLPATDLSHAGGESAANALGVPTDVDDRNVRPSGGRRK